MSLARPLGLLLLPAALAGAAPAPPETRPGLDLVFETESARATLDVLTGRVPATPEELARVAALPGNRALVQHAGIFRPAWNEASFREDLGKAARGEPLSDDVWAFALVKDRLDATRRLLGEIETDPAAFSRPVAARLAEFMPAGETVHVVVHAVVGGSSDGFAPGDGDFYLALHYFRGDADGLRLLMSHELFHVLRRRLPPPRPKDGKPPDPPNVVNVRSLLEQTMNEGVATWIGDATRVRGDGPYVAWFAQKFRRNLARLGENAALFDTILFRLDRDPAVSRDALYPIGFGGGWDSPLYFVGYAMASFLEKTDGRAAVAAAVREGPERFFARYLAAAKKSAGAPITFAPSTLEILGKLPR